MTVTVLLVADRHSERAADSASVTVMGRPDWQARLDACVASRAREGAERLGAASTPARLRDDRFVPLAAVVPVATRPH